MKRILTVCTCLVLFFTQAQDICPILPTPASYSATGGVLDLKGVTTINADGVPENVYMYLEKELHTLCQVRLESAKNQPDISFKKLVNVQDGTYTLHVAKNIVISYSSDASCFHAIQSLLQLIKNVEGYCMIPKCFVNDYPKYGWRGLHLDVSRHFFSVDEVKRFIDLMVLYKFNTFHWHLTDDQGWRIEIKKYPRLTEIGAVRDSTVIGHYSDSPRKYEVEEYKGFYTHEDIREVVKYAANRYVTVVPEIEMPGHSRAALAAYPEYSCTGEQQPVPGLWGIFDDIYCSKEETIVFMQDILSEVLELFPSKYIHIGGDEAPKTRWKACDKCQAVIRENELHDEHELQSYFIRRMDEFLTGKGRKLIGWDEILEGGLSPNAAVMSWRGEKGGIEAAKQGHYVVMSPTTYCYFDYYQSSHDAEPLAIGGFLPLEKVYKYSPVPESMPADAAPYVLGGQANLWTEYIPNMDHLEYMAYPRALALAQGLWCADKPNYRTFLDSYLTYHEEYLERHGVNVSKSIHYPTMHINRVDQGIQVNFESVKEDALFECTHKSEIEVVHSERTANITREDSITIGRPQSTAKTKHSFSIKAEGIDNLTQFTLEAHSALGTPIELITLPHPKYNHNGSLNLVDGIFGSMPWKGSEWLGFRESRIEMIVDLEKKRKLNALQIGFLENNGSWIYLPENVVVYASDDKHEWKRIGEEKVSSEKITGHSFGLTCAANTRYLMIVIETMNLIPEGMDGAGNIPWTFIDEIEIVYPDEWK